MLKPALHVRLLGSFGLTYGGRSVTDIEAPRLQSLLAYLMLHRDAPQSRQRLAFLLWQDSTEAQARTNLRKALHHLRQTLPAADHFLCSDAQTVQWRPDTSYRLDVAEFAQAAAQIDSITSLQQAIELYGGDLLPSCYDDWIVSEREQLRDQFAQVLERLAAQLEAQGDYAAAIRYAQRLVRCDPLRELTYRQVMHLAALSGDRAGIVRTYNTCVTVLRNEIDVEPSAETRQAYEQSLQVVPSEPSARVQLVSGTRSNNLPLSLSSFIGREREIRQVEKRLAAHRLVSLVGAGGVGKTRLAQVVAANLLDTFPDGVWFVDLAPLDDSAMIPQAIASVLGVQGRSDSSLLDAIADYLRDKQLLLLLDNCERLAQHVAIIASSLLQAAPQVRILSTSRQVLGIPGEVVWRVPPLSVPAIRRWGSASLDQAAVSVLARAESVQLFTDRAAAALPTFDLTDENASAVANICQRLDGVPLAIELAAARIRLLTVQQIAERLDDTFGLLTQASPAALPHHRTLQATMDWSHRLLSSHEQTLLRRLSVFSGGFTLEAAEQVCGDAPLSPGDILNELSHLVDKSLIEVERQGGSARYRLLETIREYAHNKLCQVGEDQALRRRHFVFFLKLSQDAQPILASAEHRPWLNRLDQEHDNFRAALRWVIEQQAAEVQAGLRLLENVLWVWSYGGHWQQARGWLDQILALPGAAAFKRERASVLYVAGWLAVSMGDCKWTVTLSEQALALYRELGDKAGIAGALSNLGSAADLLGEYERAECLLDEGLALRSEIRDQPRIIGLLLLNLGRVRMMCGKHAQAQALFDQALALHREAGDLWNVAWCVMHLGWLYLFQGEIDQGAITLQDSLAQFQKTGERFGTITYNLLGLAAVGVWRGKLAQAAQLAGAVEALNQATGFQLAPSLRPIYDGLETIAREQLGDAAFAAAWQQGRAMTRDEAIRYAVAMLASPDAQGP